MWEGVSDWTKTAIYWTPLLWPSALCLSRSPDAQPEARGLSFLLSAGFLYHILSPTGLQNYWGPQGPLLLGGGFPYHILSPTRLISNSIGGPEGSFSRVWLSLPHLFSNLSDLQLLTSSHTELYNSSIAYSIAHSIFGMARLIVIKRK